MNLFLRVYCYFRRRYIIFHFNRLYKSYKRYCEKNPLYPKTKVYSSLREMQIEEGMNDAGDEKDLGYKISIPMMDAMRAVWKDNEWLDYLRKL